MTLTNALKAFLNPEESSQNQNDTSDTEEKSNLPEESTQETANPSTVSEEKTASNSEDSTKDTPDTTADMTGDSVNPKAVTEGKSWPYKFKPESKTVRSGYEITQSGPFVHEDGSLQYKEDDDGNESGEPEVFMGEWPRGMIEKKLTNPYDSTWFGYQDDPTKKVDAAGIGFEWLFQHCTIFGETGSGKSTLLLNLMTQWMFAGHGLCFIDPKGGGDAESLVQRIPPERLDDLIWIEPGSNRDRMIGFNLLETDADKGDDKFDAEVQSVVSQFGEVIKNTSTGSGAVIDEVVDEVTRFLVKQDYNYNVLDLYAILFDDDDRKQLPNDVADQFDKKALESIAEKDSEDFDSIKRRVRPWVTSKTTREILDVRNSGVNITNAVENDKIIIVDVGNIEEPNVMEMFVTALVRRIWSTIQRRDKDKNPDPFFLICDEFKKVAIDRLGIGEIMSEARSFRLSITLATQQPSQLDSEVLKSVIRGSKHILTYTAGSKDDNRTLAQEMSNVTADTIKNLPSYSIVGKVMADDSPSTIISQTFPAYPPLHTPERKEEIIEESLRKYGKKAEQKEWEDEEITKYGVREADQTEEENEELLELNADTKVTLPEFLRLIFTTQAKKSSRTFDGEDGYIKKSDLRDILEKQFGELSYKVLGKIVVEEISEDILKTKDDDDIYFKLTENGEAVAFDQDSGSGGSSGGAKHRKTLATAWKEFTRLGYDMEVPNQEDWGEDPPDGVAVPPIQPAAESTTSSEFYELEERLKSEYPQVYKLFEDKTVAVEAETTTQSKPHQTIKNLAKAIKRNQDCALVTRERITNKEKKAREKLADSDDETENASDYDPYENTTPTEALEKEVKHIHNILTNPPFVSKMDGQNRIFYNQNAGKKIELKDGSYALQKKNSSQTKWREDDNTVILDNGTDDETVTFRKASEIMDNPSRRKFNYHYKQDTRENVIVVRDASDNVIETYDTVTQMKNDGWKTVIPPSIPETLFDTAGEEQIYPSNDTWKILVTPRGINPKYDSDKLYIYNREGSTPEEKFTPFVPDENSETKTETEDEPQINIPNVSGDTDSETTDETDEDERKDTPSNKETNHSESKNSQEQKETDQSNKKSGESQTNQETPQNKPKASQDKSNNNTEEKTKPTESTKPSVDATQNNTEEDTDSNRQESTNSDDAWASYRSDKSDNEKTTNDSTDSNQETNKTTEEDDKNSKKERVEPTETSGEKSDTDENNSSSTEDEDEDTDDEKKKEDEDEDEVWGSFTESNIDL